MNTSKQRWGAGQTGGLPTQLPQTHSRFEGTRRERRERGLHSGGGVEAKTPGRAEGWKQVETA